MDTYGEAGGYGEGAELYGGGGGGGGGGGSSDDTNRIGGTGAIRKPPRLDR